MRTIREGRKQEKGGIDIEEREISDMPVDADEDRYCSSWLMQ